MNAAQYQMVANAARTTVPLNDLEREYGRTFRDLVAAVRGSPTFEALGPTAESVQRLHQKLLTQRRLSRERALRRRKEQQTL
jgi:hypothetical protein